MKSFELIMAKWSLDYDIQWKVYLSINVIKEKTYMQVTRIIS